MNLTKLFALFGATILLSNYLPAQDDVDIEDADEVEEVVVTGIKRSLLDAIDIKEATQVLLMLSLQRILENSQIII